MPAKRFWKTIPFIFLPESVVPQGSGCSLANVHRPQNELGPPPRLPVVSDCLRARAAYLLVDGARA